MGHNSPHTDHPITHLDSGGLTDCNNDSREADSAAKELHGGTKQIVYFLREAISERERKGSVVPALLFPNSLTSETLADVPKEGRSTPPSDTLPTHTVDQPPEGLQPDCYFIRRQ